MMYWPAVVVSAPIVVPTMVTCAASIARRDAESTMVPFTTPFPCADTLLALTTARQHAASAYTDHDRHFIRHPLQRVDGRAALPLRNGWRRGARWDESFGNLANR